MIKYCVIKDFEHPIEGNRVDGAYFEINLAYLGRKQGEKNFGSVEVTYDPKVVMEEQIRAVAKSLVKDKLSHLFTVWQFEEELEKWNFDDEAAEQYKKFHGKYPWE